MANELEQWARELLAAEYDRDGRCNIARDLRLGFNNSAIDMAIRAIAAALQQAQQPGAQAVAWRYVRQPEEGCMEGVAGAWGNICEGHASVVQYYRREGCRIEYAYAGAPPPLPEGVSHDDIAAAVDAFEAEFKNGSLWSATKAALESYRARLAAKGGV